MMKKYSLLIGGAALLTSSPVFAEALEGKKGPSEILAESAADDWRAIDPENTLYIELESGRVVVALSTYLAQNHVAQVKKLAREGFYDGLSFYRVIEGFVAQGGDALEQREIKTAEKTMTAEFEESLPDDVHINIQDDADGYAAQIGWVDSLPVGVDAERESIWHLHCTGAFAFGRANEKDSASTEFYITLQPQRYLDRNLSVFGRVVDGMEHLQALRRVAPPASEDDDMGETIVAMRVAADVPAEEQTPFEILDSSRDVFTTFIESRRNRPEEFFYVRHDYIDICQLPVPVRPVSSDDEE